MDYLSRAIDPSGMMGLLSNDSPLVSTLLLVTSADEFLSRRLRNGALHSLGRVGVL